MKRKNLLVSLLTLAAMVMVFVVTGTGTMQAQMLPGSPCRDYWVDYNYTYPPAPNGAFEVAVECADGRILPGTIAFTDGHFTYTADPTCHPVLVHIRWIDPVNGPQDVAVPIPVQNATIMTPWGILRVETKFDSKGCLEIKISF